MKVYRSINKVEFAKLMLGIPITGTWSSRWHPECAYSGYFGSVVCAFTDKIQWRDPEHNIFLELDIPEEAIVEEGNSVWMMPKAFSKTKIYKGRAGDVQHDLHEVFFKEYDIRNVSKILEIHSPEYALGEIYRYHHNRCPHYEHGMSREEMQAEFDKYLEVFPESKTAIPKAEYKTAFLRLTNQMLEGR